MGKHPTSGPGSSGSSRVERITEILDEDHLQFEELLLDIQQRLEVLNATVRAVGRRIDDLAGDIDESRQIQAGIDAKIDQLRIAVSELNHRLETAPSPP